MPLLIDSPAHTSKKLRHGFFEAFPPQPVPNPHFFIDGVEWLLDPCLVPEPFEDLVCVPATGQGPKPPFQDAVGDLRSVVPLHLTVAVLCSTLPASVNVSEKAKTVLDNYSQEFVLDAHLTYLLDLGITTSTAAGLSPLCAYAEVVQALGVYGPATLYVAPNVLTVLVDGNLLKDNGTDFFGNRVVAATNLDGSIVAEGPSSLVVYRSEPIELSDDIRSTNTRLSRWEISYLTVSDPCVVVQATGIECP